MQDTEFASLDAAIESIMLANDCSREEACRRLAECMNKPGLFRPFTETIKTKVRGKHGNR